MYILLTRSGTSLSKIVHLVTGAEYTHAAIGLSPDELYTMTRMDLSRALPAGLRLEHPYEHLTHVLLQLRTSKEVESNAATLLHDMYVNREQYAFNIIGLPLALVKYNYPRENKFFCSEFCSKILRESGAYAFAKPDNLVRPMDFLGIPGIQRRS